MTLFWKLLILLALALSLYANYKLWGWEKSGTYYDYYDEYDPPKPTTDT